MILAIAGISCQKDNPTKKEETKCVCDITVTYNGETIESQKGVTMDGCVTGRHSTESYKAKLKTGETVTAKQEIICYAQ